MCEQLVHRASVFPVSSLLLLPQLYHMVLLETSDKLLQKEWGSEKHGSALSDYSLGYEGLTTKCLKWTEKFWTGRYT